jgi:SAM-dependent methyltransferase
MSTVQRSDVFGLRALAGRVLDGATLSRKILDRELRPVLKALQPGIVLDVGGASGLRYRRLINHRRYWTVDIQSKNQPSIQADAHRLPVKTGSVDAVVSLQLLEHCRDPRLVVEEAHRVLRPGGCLVLSTVLLYELHASPHDYYRFTASALEDLARPFETSRIIPLGNRFVAAYDLLPARSVLLNTLLGRLAFRLGSRPSHMCPTGFILIAGKAAS